MPQGDRNQIKETKKGETGSAMPPAGPPPGPTVPAPETPSAEAPLLPSPSASLEQRAVRRPGPLLPPERFN